MAHGAWVSKRYRAIEALHRGRRFNLPVLGGGNATGRYNHYPGFRGTMNEQFEKFLKNPWPGPGFRTFAGCPCTIDGGDPPSRAMFYRECGRGMPAIHEPITQAVGQATSSPAHPEEIRAKVNLRLGKRSRLNATLRTTPAGLVSAGMNGGRHFLTIAALVRAARRRY